MHLTPAQLATTLAVARMRGDRVAVEMLTKMIEGAK